MTAMSEVATALEKVGLVNQFTSILKHQLGDAYASLVKPNVHIKADREFSITMSWPLEGDDILAFTLSQQKVNVMLMAGDMVETWSHGWQEVSFAPSVTKALVQLASAPSEQQESV